MVVCTFTEFAKVFGFGVFTGIVGLILLACVVSHIKDKGPHQ